MMPYSTQYIGDIGWLIAVIILNLECWIWCIRLSKHTKHLFDTSENERRLALKFAWHDAYIVTVLLTSFSLLLSYTLFIQIPSIITQRYNPSLLHEMGLIIATSVIIGITCIYAKTNQFGYTKWPFISKILHRLFGRVVMKGDT